MSTSGSSTGFSVFGLGGGIDWSTYIDKVKEAKTQQINRTLGKQSNKLTGQTKVFNAVQSVADAFRTKVKGFASSKDFLTKTVSSTDANVVTGTASLAAVNQTNTISVEKLATNEIWQASAASVAGSVTSADGTLTITVRGNAQVINVVAGTTLTQLAAQLNAADIGISATVYDTGDGTATSARLSITDNISGKSNPDQTMGMNYNLGFVSTLTDLNTAAFDTDPVVEGMDAQVKMNGSAETIYRESNKLTDVVPGVTIDLVSADPGVSKTISVTSSSTAGATKIQEFISKYNSLVQELKKDLKFDLNLAKQNQDQTNPTASNSTLRSMLEQLQSSILSTVNSLPQGKSIRSLSDLGITSVYSAADAADNGTLQLDEGKLASVLASNFDDVVSFFEGVRTDGTVYDGFSQKLDQIMDGFLNSTQGSIPSAIKSAALGNLNITSAAQKKFDQIDREDEVLRARFSRLEAQLAALNQQGSQIESVFNSLNGTKKKN